MNSVKELKDECSLCGDILVCELCLQGHGIKRPRQNIAQMVECQFKHQEKRKGVKE